MHKLHKCNFIHALQTVIGLKLTKLKWLTWLSRSLVCIYLHMNRSALCTVRGCTRGYFSVLVGLVSHPMNLNNLSVDFPS